MAPETPPGALAAVREEAAGCRRCPLWEIGTQTVFGDGPSTATVMFVGEAPGQQEDARGQPFVGPAGRLFDEALRRAGIDRGEVYVTNTVKHRPWLPGGRGGRNRPPKQSEVNACRVWLEAELRLVRPEIVCCLGAVAARALLGRDFRITQERGQWRASEWAPAVIATVHPSYVLKQPPDTAEQVRESFFADVALVAERLRGSRAA